MQKTKKQPTTKTKRMRMQLVIIGVVLGVPLLITSAWWGINGYLDIKDREKFESVREDVDQVAAKLQAVDADVEWETNASCDRTNVKFQEGTPWCWVRVKAEIEVHNDAEASDIIRIYNDAYSAIDSFTAIDSYNPTYHPNFPENLEAGFAGQGFRHNFTDIVCGSLYEISKDNPNELHLSFDCTDLARDTWFPRADA